MAFRFVLSLLVVISVVEGCFGLTLSSKLIHAYSDEAKALWGARSKNLSVDTWPERKSSEFYRLLLGRDLTRQKMKLQHDFLFPSKGSHTLFFGDELDW